MNVLLLAVLLVMPLLHQPCVYSAAILPPATISQITAPADLITQDPSDSIRLDKHIPSRKRLQRVRLRHLLHKHQLRSSQWHHAKRSSAPLRRIPSESDEIYYPDGASDYVHEGVTDSIVDKLSSDADESDETHEQLVGQEGEVESESEGELSQMNEEKSDNEGGGEHESKLAHESSNPSEHVVGTTANADEVAVSKTIRSASVPVAQEEFRQDTLGEEVGHFRGLENGNADDVNVTHLSYMVFKIIKQYEVKSLIDIPCRTTLKWFPELLHRLDFEVIGFKYYCVDTEHYSQDDIRTLFDDSGSPEFLHIRPEEAYLLPKTDMVFSWDGPQQWGVKRTWDFFTALREIRPKYILITNNPGVSNTNDERGLLNLRKQPFHFSQAMRVISKVHDGEVPKQLLLYEMGRVRRDF